MKKISCIVLASLAVSACAERYSSNGENLYLKSTNGPMLVVPPPLTRANISTYHNLSAQTQDPRVSIVPLGSEITTS